MKKFALIVLTLCVPVLAWPATPMQPAASVQWSGTAHDSVFALARRGDELWAGTSFGLLLKRNSEPEWRTAIETQGRAVLGIGFSPQGDGVAVGQSGLLMDVKPNTERWTIVNSGVKDRLMWVVSNSRGDFLVVGAFGTVLYRPAGGQWQKVAVKSAGGEERHLYSAIFVSDDEALIVGENETLMDFGKGKITQGVELGQPPKSSKPGDAGQGDQGQEAVTPSLFAVTYCDGMLVAAGQRGLVLTKVLSTETKSVAFAEKRAGATQGKAEVQTNGLLAGWQASGIAGDPDVYGLVCTPTGTLVGVSNNGTIVSGTRQAGTGIEWQTLYAKGLYAPWLSAALPAGDDSFLVAGPANIWEVSLSNGK